MSQIKTKQAGRVAARIAEELKGLIAAGKMTVGQYLPGIRDIARARSVSPETARRALKLLESEHWLRCYPGHGFKITAKANDPAASAPVAFILSGREDAGRWTSFGQQLLSAMYKAAERRGWSMLGIGAGGRSTAEVIDEIRKSRASGLLIDTANQELASELLRLGIPTVLVEELWPGLDSVTQDNFGGALQAAEYLVHRGHRRLGIFGILGSTVQGRERWAGAQVAARLGDARFIAEGRIGQDSGGTQKDIERLRRSLRGPDRITGILCLWWNVASVVAGILEEEGASTELVSWCPREQLQEFRASWPGKSLPATVVWSIEELGEAALARLGERRERPDTAPVRISVKVELLPAE